jgi:hypothetical protein
MTIILPLITLAYLQSMRDIFPKSFSLLLKIIMSKKFTGILANIA